MGVQKASLVKCGRRSYEQRSDEAGRRGGEEARRRGGEEARRRRGSGAMKCGGRDKEADSGCRGATREDVSREALERG
jgi:hypothetical protein